MTNVRIDTVTLALFRHFEVALEDWADRLRPTPGTSWRRDAVDHSAWTPDNPCSEIPLGDPDPMDLATYHYVDEGPIPGAPADADTARILDGTVRLGPGVIYDSPGVRIGRQRESGILRIERRLPETALAGAVGSPARLLVDHPALGDATVVAAHTIRSPDGDHVAITVDCGWTTVAIDRDLPRHPRCATGNTPARPGA